MTTFVPSSRKTPAQRSIESKLMLLRDVRNMWTGPIDTDIYDEKLVSMSNQGTNHLYWLARNKQMCAKQRPHTARIAGDKYLSEGSWSNLSVMFNSPTTSRHTDDMSSVTSSSSKVRSFCYLCSTMEEHQRCHLNRTRSSVSQDGSVRERRQRVRYVPPTPRTRRRVEEEVEAPLVQEALYKVSVYTGDVAGASTDANVYISITGDGGELPKTKLQRRQGASGFCFVRGARDVFHIKGPKLGELRSITVQHDGVDERQSWHLDRVEVQCMMTRRVWQFCSNSWLAVHPHGAIKTNIQQIQAVLKQHAVREYEVIVETGKKRFAGTDANVYLTLQGSKGSSRRLHLNAQHPHGSCFQRGHSDSFKVTTTDIGHLRSLRIEHDGEGPGSSWYLTKVMVRDVLHPQGAYHFVCGGWLATDMGDGRTWRELSALKQMPQNALTERLVQYEVIVKTGDVYGAGTTADVYIFLNGATAKTKRMFLSDTTSNFERSKTESFQLRALDVGQLTSVRIGVDSTGPDAGWFCDHIKVRKALSRQEISETLTQLKQEWRAVKTQQQREAHTASNSRLQDIAAGKAQQNGEERKREAKNADDDENNDEEKIAEEEKNMEGKNQEEENGRKENEEGENNGAEEDADAASTSPRMNKNGSENRWDISLTSHTKKKSQWQISLNDQTSSVVEDDAQQHREIPTPVLQQECQTPKRGTEYDVLRVFTDSGRVRRVPVWEEFFFPCSRWLGSRPGDDDGAPFERQLPVMRQRLHFQERETGTM